MKAAIFLALAVTITSLIGAERLFVYYEIDMQNTCRNGMTTLAVQKFEAKAVKRTLEREFVEDLEKRGECFRKTSLFPYIIRQLSQR